MGVRAFMSVQEVGHGAGAGKAQESQQRAAGSDVREGDLPQCVEPHGFVAQTRKKKPRPATAAGVAVMSQNRTASRHVSGVPSSCVVS